MADYIVSADAGNGGTNVVIARKNGGYKRYYEPSVRAVATGDSLGLGESFEMQYEYVDWYGNRYVTGDDVIRVTRRGLERHIGANRYGDEFHQFLVANALARLGVKNGTIDLTLFAPPGLFTQVKQEIIERFMENGGIVEIKVKGDRKPRQWQYENVTVWPEGLGAAICFVVDDNGDPVDTDILSGETVILDIGAFTLDALKLQDGNFNPESLEHATWENAGVHTHVREPLLRMLHKRQEDFRILTVDDVDSVLRKGFETGDFTVTVAGMEVNLAGAVQNLCERYADWVANNICDGVFNGFRGIKSVILVGGGAVLIQDKIMELYGTFNPGSSNKGGKILDARKHPLTRKVHPVDMNAVGGLRFAMMRQKQNAPG
ncbi:MAG TPA: ParM/StbA family protein [Aggregatilineales bacterium]|nr:ParM/StbA family protein [Aggregatilineales bacterium]